MRARTRILHQRQHTPSMRVDECIASTRDESSEFGARLRHRHPCGRCVGAERKRPAIDDLVAGGVEDLDVLAFVEDCVRARAGGDGCWSHDGGMIWIEG